MKYNTLLIVFFLNLSLLSVRAQSMAVNQLNGSVSNFDMSTVTNMTFTAGSFNVITQGSTNSFPLTNFKNFKFSNGYNDFVNPKSNEDIFRVFPNPVKTNLMVKLNEDVAHDASISVFSLDGNLVISQSIYTPTFSIDFSKLSSGFYFCSYFNGSTIKTIKIVKE